MKRTPRVKKSKLKPTTLTINSPVGIDRVIQFVAVCAQHTLRIGLIFAAGSFFTVILGVCAFGLFYLHTLARSAGMNPTTLVGHLIPPRLSMSAETIRPVNILVLGTDSLANRDTTSKLTDTIMVFALQPDRSRIVSFSIPRDLWIASQSAKINSLYAKNPDLAAKQISVITGVDISHTIVVDIATVGKLIDALGGLDILVERSFVDFQFPRSDVDVRKEKNPAKLYETVAFTKGMERMSGDRALRYIRSRHSLDPVEGSDDARIRRQQQVIQSLLHKIQDPLLLRQPEQIGAALRIYSQDVQTTMDLEILSQLAWQFVRMKSRPQFISRQLTVVGAEESGVLMHPERFPGGIWVYLPVDPTYNQLRALVHAWISE